MSSQKMVIMSCRLAQHSKHSKQVACEKILYLTFIFKNVFGLAKYKRGFGPGGMRSLQQIEFMHLSDRDRVWLIMIF